MSNLDRVVFSKFIFIIFFILGSLLTFILPPYNYTFIGFLVFPILLFLLEKNKIKNYKFFFLSGLLFGFGYFLFSLYWISYSLNFDENLKILKPVAIILLPIILSIFYGLIFLIFKNFVEKSFDSVLVFSIIFVLIEFLRGVIFTGFPWNLVVYTLSDKIEFLQYLKIIGTHGLELLLIILFCIPYLLLCNLKLINKVLIVFTTILSLFLFFVVGKKLLDQKLIKQETDFVILQPNENILNIYNRPTKHLNNLIEISDPENHNEDTIFVWPEGSIYLEDFKPNIKNLEKIFSSRFRSNQKIILGAINKYNKKTYNSIIVVNSQGKILDKYNKIKLVPFGEYIPFEKLIRRVGFKKITFGYDSFTKGTYRNIIKINGTNLLPIICYEIIYSGRINTEKHNFDIIINLSEDGWFNKSIGTYQHFYHSIFRAIEEGKQVIRSTNQGITASILPNGLIHKEKSLINGGKIHTKAYLLENNTLFSKYGNLIFSLLIVILLVLQNIFKRIIK